MTQLGRGAGKRGRWPFFRVAVLAIALSAMVVGSGDMNVAP